MGWRRAALGSVFALFILGAAAATWLWTADLGVFKPQLERWVSAQTGREFRIEGPLSVDLGRQSVVSAQDIRFENAEWAEQPEMVAIGRLEVRLETWSLIDGPIRIALIELDDAQVHLIRREEGDPNWALPIEQSPTKEQAAGDETPLDVLVKQTDIDRVEIVYESPDRTEPLDLYIELLDQAQGPDGLLAWELRATLEDRDVTVSGEIGPWQALLTGRDVRFDLEAQLDTLKLEGGGRIDDLIRPYRPSLEFTASGPDIDDLTHMLGLGEEGDGNIELSGSLKPQQDGPLLLDVGGNLGQTEIDASGAFSDLQDLRQIDIDLLASGPDLGRILSLFGIHRVREAPFVINLDAQRQGSELVVKEGNMLFGEAQFDLSARLPNFPSLDESTISLQIEGPDLERFRYVLDLPGAATGPFSLAFDIGVAPDGVEILDLDLQTTLLQIQGEGELGDGPDYIGSEFRLQASSDSLARVAEAYGVGNLPDRPITLTGAAGLTADGIQTRGPVVVEVNDVSVSADGLVAIASGLKGSKLAFDLKGPDLAAFSTAFGAEAGVPNEPYDLAGNLEIRDDGYRLRDVAGSLGTSAVKLDGLLTTNPGLAGTRFAIDARGAAIEELIDELGDYEVMPGPYTLSGDAQLTADRVDITDLKLERPRGEVALDLQLGLPVARRWANFDLQANGRDVRVVLESVEGFQADELPFSADVRGELRGSSIDFDRFIIEVGDARFQARGELQVEDEGGGGRFFTQGSIPSLARLGLMNGRRMRDQSLAWDAEMTSRAGVLRIDDMLVELGDSAINGDVVYRAGDIPELTVDIYSESIVLAPLLEEAEEEDQYDPEPEFEDGRVIPDIPVPFETMRGLNASVNVAIGDLQRDTLYMRDIKLRADLRDGVLDIAEVGFLARSGWLTARARVEPSAGGGRASVALKAREFAPGISDLNKDLAMTGDLDINLESSGADLRELLGNANGILFARSRGGRIADTRMLRGLYGDTLNEVIAAINPFSKKDPYTSFECVVLPLEIVDGRVTGNPVSFVSTNKIRITSSSTVDLKTEKLDFNIRTRPRKGLGISAAELVNPYVKIVGTMAAPRLAVDQQGVLVSGGAAVATGGLSILAKAAWDRIAGAGDACAKAEEQAKAALQDRFPDFPDPPVAEPEVAAGNVRNQ